MLHFIVTALDNDVQLLRDDLRDYLHQNAGHAAHISTVRQRPVEAVLFKVQERTPKDDRIRGRLIEQLRLRRPSRRRSCHSCCRCIFIVMIHISEELISIQATFSSSLCTSTRAPPPPFSLSSENGKSRQPIWVASKTMFARIPPPHPSRSLPARPSPSPPARPPSSPAHPSTGRGISWRTWVGLTLISSVPPSA